MPHDDLNPNAFYGGGLAVESYDLFAGEAGKLTGDIEFYLDLARDRGGKVLELACGTGRILTPLVEAGFEVTGVDISRAMLDLADRKLQALRPSAWGRARLVCSPMQAFETQDRFDLVLIPARSFQHLVDPVDQRKTLERVWRCLNPGGMLVIDMFDARLEVCVGVPPAPPPREVVDPVSGRRFRRTCLGRHTNPFEQTTGERMRIEELDAQGDVLGSHETSWTLRWSTRQEMAYLLELTGFEALSVYSDFQRSPAAYGGEQIWVARAV